MSVDANVLVNERMREELRAGKSPREAVKLGWVTRNVADVVKPPPREAPPPQNPR